MEGISSFLNEDFCITLLSISVRFAMTLYVSDPKMWEQAFKDLSTGKANVYTRSPQTGRGLGGRYSSPSHYLVKAPAEKDVIIKKITPTAAVAERAESDLKREKRDNVPHVDPNSINKRRILHRRPAAGRRRRVHGIFGDD